MTGFGRAATVAGGRRLVVELRSVNHRGFDLKVRARELDPACEVEMLRAVRAGVARGAVTVSIRDESVSELELPLDRIRDLHATLNGLRQELGISKEVDLGTVAAFVGASTGPALDLASEVPWEDLKPAVDEALAALQAMRAREGEALAAELRRRVAGLTDLGERIGRAASVLPTKAARRLEARLAALGAEVAIDPARLAQEVAFLAEKLDVTEELVRLDTHLRHLVSLLGGEPPSDERGGVGRKLDFVIQEVGRELNTVGSKVQDAEVATLVIDAKAELEKIREQAQNIE